MNIFFILLTAIISFSCTSLKEKHSNAIVTDVCIDLEPPRSKQAVSDTIPQPPPPPPPPPPPQDVDDIGRFARMDSLHDERVERTELLIDKIKSHCKARLIRTAVLQIIVFVDGSVELERIVFREGYDDDSKQLLENCIQEYLEQEQPNMGPLLMKKTARARPTKILWTIPLEVD